MRNRSFGAIVIAAVFVFSASTVSSQKAPPAVPPSLASVQWAGRPASFAALKGKTVVVLVYAKWCPKCNAWSGEFFTQLKEAVKDKWLYKNAARLLK